MALVPVGKRRLMVAQAAPNPMAEQAGEIDTEGVESGQTQMTEQPQEAEPQVEDPAGEMERQVDMAANQQQQAAGEAESGGDIRKTIFDFLVGLGYPPRRLQEFKSQFVSETGSANSGTQVTVVLPDEVYGKNTQIPREKLKELVQLVEQHHGLSFQDYKRANEQLTLNFMTADAAAQASLENAGPGDILDKVYGKPGGKSKGGKGLAPKGAMSIHELIKESKDKQLAVLKGILTGYNGDKR